MKVILRILPHYLEQNVTQNVQNQIIGKYFIITVWGRKFDSFYNIDKRRQIRFNILPTVYGSEFDDFYLCYKNCHFCFPILYGLSEIQ